MRPTDKATADSGSVQSFAIIKNTGHGNCFTLGVFTLELEMDNPFLALAVNNKIPVSSVFNDSEGLYGTTVSRCLVRRPHYSAQLMRFGSCSPSAFPAEMP